MASDRPTATGKPSVSSHIFSPMPDGDCTRAELEAYIESERILYILDKTLSKTEVAVSLPLLFKNRFKLLQPLLTEKELFLIFEWTQSLEQTKRARPRPSRSSKLNQEHSDTSVEKFQLKKERDRLRQGFVSFFGLATKKFEGGLDPLVNESFNEREDPGLCKIIHMLCSKPRNRLQRLIKDKNEELSPGCVNFLTNINKLRNLVDARLKISPSALRRREEELRIAWRWNEKAKLDIDILASKLDLYKMQALALSDSKDEVIQEQQMKLAKQARDCKYDIRMIVNASEDQMVQECKQYVPRLQKLTQEVKGNKLKISTLLQEHLQSEQNLRARNLRIEGQLVAWLEKYDQDIGEKQAEWDEVKAGFDAEVDEMFILQDEFDIQKEEHEKLMAEKEDEYQHELEEKMFIFICNRAARRIQKYWRSYRERKLARKRKHKGKKGKGSGKTK